MKTAVFGCCIFPFLITMVPLPGLVSSEQLCSKDYQCMPISVCQELDDVDIHYPCGEESVCCSVPPESPSTIASRSSVLPSDCGIVISTNRITGGELAAIGQFPWMALLGYKQKGLPFVQFLCGGSLITKEHILTAAHCVSIDPRLKLEVVRLGEYNLDVGEDCDGSVCTNSTDFAIDNIIVHDKFVKMTLENDIALIKLTQPVEFTEYIQPICLRIENSIVNYTPAVNQKLIVSGWGKTDSNNIGGSSRLMYTSVAVWDSRKCTASVPPKIRPIRDSQICANGVKRADACKGDSGGPLINNTVVATDLVYYQVGIVSFATALTCGNVELPTVYTRVEYFMDWILTNIQ